jgi:uncharacterized protein YjbI with pentapeptide repeats
MKPPKHKKPAAFRRDLPDLPAGFPEPPTLDSLLQNDEIVAEDQLLRGLAMKHRSLRTFRAQGCVLENVQRSGAQFGATVWRDVRLTGCDLANVQAHRITLVRVEFIGCRLTGFRTSALDWRDVLVEDCDLAYAQLQRGLFRACEFRRSNCPETDLQQADLGGSLLRACNLTRADLRGARLQDADLRDSGLDGVLVNIEDLRGAVVDANQAVSLARLMGLQIR